MIASQSEKEGTQIAELVLVDAGEQQVPARSLGPDRERADLEQARLIVREPRRELHDADGLLGWRGDLRRGEEGQEERGARHRTCLARIRAQPKARAKNLQLPADAEPEARDGAELQRGATTALSKEHARAGSPLPSGSARSAERGSKVWTSTLRRRQWLSMLCPGGGNGRRFGLETKMVQGASNRPRILDGGFDSYSPTTGSLIGLAKVARVEWAAWSLLAVIGVVTPTCRSSAWDRLGGLSGETGARGEGAAKTKPSF